jgi:hypothetical protein
VQAYPAGSQSAAFEVAFTQVSFTRPDAAQFQFNPPRGAKVTEESRQSGEPAAPDSATDPAAKAQRPAVVGTGWTSVLVAKLPAGAMTTAQQAGGRQGGFSLGSLPTVSGGWGSGHLLKGRLFSVLLTDDGRVLAGAVAPERLYEAAAAK